LLSDRVSWPVTRTLPLRQLARRKAMWPLSLLSDRVS
jgi:hypothetical protein